MTEKSFLKELRQRKVVQTAAVYIAVAWGATEILVTVTEQLFLPAWISTLVVIAFVVGFPVAMFLAWTFDVTKDGIQRTSIESRKGKASIAVSLLLLIAGTTGLFFLIAPNQQQRNTGVADVSIVPNSVAVLPFENAGQDQDDLFLSEGLSDELRDQLGRVAGIRIAARTSSIAARSQGLDARTISTQLGVANLVEGSLRRLGNRLRISVSLIEGSSGLALWSQTFERGPNELLAVQDSIATAIVKHVLPEASSVKLDRATKDVTANELMLLARHYEQQVRDRQITDERTLLEAVRLYREATEADPGSALAHSRLAGVLLFLGDIEAAEAPLFKALALNPNLSEVQNTRGEFYWARGLPDAMEAFQRAVELNPNNTDALHNYANNLWLSMDPHSTGIEDLAVLFHRSLELDPLSLSRHAALGEFLGQEGRHEETRAVIRGIRNLFDSVESYRVIGWLNELIGEYDEAIAWTILARDHEPDNPDHVAKLAALYTELGDFDTALSLEPEPSLYMLFLMRRYAELIDAAEFQMIEEPDDVGVRYLLAFAYNATGQFESAIHILHSVGLPDSLLNNAGRTVLEIQGYYWLASAMAALENPEATALARSLVRTVDTAWHGAPEWIAVYRGCSLAIEGRHEEALELFLQLGNSTRLFPEAELRDAPCFRGFADEPGYEEVLLFQNELRTRARERLSATLEEFGVSL